MKILEDDRDRCVATRSLDELEVGVEEIPALLFGRQLERFGDVWKDAAELRHQLRDGRRGIAERMAERGRRHVTRAVLEHFDERYVRRRAFHLVTVAGQA